MANKARENVSDQVVIGFSFASDWLSRWRVFFVNQSQNVLKKNQSNPGLLSTLNRKPRYAFHTRIRKRPVNGDSYPFRNLSRGRKCWFAPRLHVDRSCKHIKRSVYKRKNVKGCGLGINV